MNYIDISFRNPLYGAKTGLFLGLAASMIMTNISDRLGDPLFSLYCLNVMVAGPFFGALVGGFNLMLRRFVPRYEDDFEVIMERSAFAIMSLWALVNIHEGIYPGNFVSMFFTAPSSSKEKTASLTPLLKKYF